MQREREDLSCGHLTSRSPLRFVDARDATTCRFRYRCELSALVALTACRPPYSQRQMNNTAIVRVRDVRACVRKYVRACVRARMRARR